MRFVAFEGLVDFMETRMPVGMGIFAFVVWYQREEEKDE